MRNIVPNVTFKTRVRDESISGSNPFRWQDTTTDDYFKNKRVVVFSLPGAFTPTCSTYQVPGFEKNYDRIRNCGVDEVYCISVNDAFVMNKWAQDQQVVNIKMIPDGAGEFTRMMGMLVDKPKQGFGQRSWRYAMVVNNGVIEKLWEEPGINNMSADDDPYGQSSPETVLQYLENTM
jgi:peroxiredoxin